MLIGFQKVLYYKIQKLTGYKFFFHWAQHDLKFSVSPLVSCSKLVIGTKINQQKIFLWSWSQSGSNLFVKQFVLKSKNKQNVKLLYSNSLNYPVFPSSGGFRTNWFPDQLLRTKCYGQKYGIQLAGIGINFKHKNNISAPKCPRQQHTYNNWNCFELLQGVVANIWLFVYLNFKMLYTKTLELTEHWCLIHFALIACGAKFTFSLLSLCSCKDLASDELTENKGLNYLTGSNQFKNSIF